jgi:hypothetical protein
VEIFSNKSFLKFFSGTFWLKILPKEPMVSSIFEMTVSSIFGMMVRVPAGSYGNSIFRSFSRAS